MVRKTEWKRTEKRTDRGDFITSRANAVVNYAHNNSQSCFSFKSALLGILKYTADGNSRPTIAFNDTNDVTKMTTTLTVNKLSVDDQ